MSVRPTFSVFCDYEPGCAEWIGQEDTAGAARQLARAAGWQHVSGIGGPRGLDFCREHRTTNPDRDIRRNGGSVLRPVRTSRLRKG